MRLKLLMLATTVMLASGCATTRMIDSPQQALVPPSNNQAQIVFVRSSFVGSAIQAVIYDATDDGAEFVGILSNAKKLAYRVDPGRHVFMVVSEAADFLEAELDGGKTYYAMVTPRMGAWRARFSLFPVRNSGPGEFQYGSERFQEWLEEAQFVQNTPESLAWAEQNQASVHDKQTEYWEVWREKTPDDLAERTLNSDDGV